MHGNPGNSSSADRSWPVRATPVGARSSRARGELASRCPSGSTRSGIARCRRCVPRREPGTETTKGSPMKATGFTHTSVHAHDLDESVRFYQELFGMEEIPAPAFPFPVRWLRVGDLQLHLFQSDEAAPRGHHFGLDVDDFEAVYERAHELGVAQGDGYFSKVYELPEGAVQLYLRDPAGNMVEVNWPDVSTLDREVVGGIQKIPAPDGQEPRLYPRS